MSHTATATKKKLNGKEKEIRTKRQLKDTIVVLENTIEREIGPDGHVLILRSFYGTDNGLYNKSPKRLGAYIKHLEKIAHNIRGVMMTNELGI